MAALHKKNMTTSVDLRKEIEKYKVGLDVEKSRQNSNQRYYEALKS